MHYIIIGIVILILSITGIFYSKKENTMSHDDMDLKQEEKVDDTATTTATSTMSEIIATTTSTSTEVKATSTGSSTTSTTSKSTSTQSTGTKSTSVYKDGSYTKEGVYMSPAGTERLGVTLTIKNDVITSAVVTGKADNKASINFQNKFMSGYESKVVGKKIDEVKLTVVNGASLSPIGFMDALSKIKTDAHN